MTEGKLAEDDQGAPEALGRALAQELLSAGGAEILQALREA